MSLVITPTPSGVTSVSATSPVVSTGGPSPNISMSQANSTTNGYLTSTDWTTFNSKAPAFTYTSTYIPYGQGTTTPNQSSGLTYDGTTFGTTGVAALKNTSAFSWNTGSASTAATIIGTSGTGGSHFTNTPSLNSSFSSGLAIDGSYATQTSTINIRAVGVNSAGGYGSTLNFYTSNNASQVLAASIDKNQNVSVSTGNLVIGTSGKGIDFSANTPAAGMTSQLLNWYEEGTFTPTIYGSSVVGTGTYSTQVGTYVRVGKSVTFTIILNWSAHTGSGNMYIDGLPFTSADATGCAWRGDGITLTAGNYLTMSIDAGTNNIVFIQTATGTVSGNYVPLDTAGFIIVSGSYICS